MKKKFKLFLTFTIFALLVNVPGVLAATYYDSTVSGKHPNNPSYYIWVLHMTTRLYPYLPKVEGRIQFILQSPSMYVTEVGVDYVYLWVDCDNGGADSKVLQTDSAVIEWGDPNMLVTITFSVTPDIASDTRYSTTIYIKLVYVVYGSICTRYIHNQNIWFKTGFVYRALSSGWCVTLVPPVNLVI